ncbi:MULTISPECIES: heavy-metal-associated domain-containing protein [Acidithrix]|uniref:Copper chaperone CopZ n=1 Tax=Acidithrix ferrooxidans TaxID=1280514 RepID=A0A0D8HKZ3_9ACTN|nr:MULTISPECIES: heavy-metal-associated domain-containing protein [Acidithrix]KJF18387.1 copper chaperone CopZ [Acidithrix ferrooxidans]CAG4920506.1 unnamed protein product [Acidithrix sp. C25]
METKSYKVEGMTCGHCVAAVKGEIDKVAGVSQVDVDLETKLVVVSGEKLDDAEIFNAVDEAGYEAQLV